MADSPFKPKADLKIGLPKISPGMNKLPPLNLSGGKGGKDDATLGLRNEPKKPKKKRPAVSATAPDDDPRTETDDEVSDTEKTPDPKDDAKKLSEKEKAKLLSRIRKRMDRCISAESENRANALDDMKFKAGDQWPADVKAQRNTDKRPCLTINKIPVFVHQITNDLRQNRPAINISPVGDKGDPEVAKMYKGLIRAIERDCAADIAYDTGADCAVSVGFGYWRVLTEFERPASFDQVIVIRRVRNPFTVYLDPDHQEPDGADCKFGFVSEELPRTEFEDEYPDAQPMPFEQAGTGDSLKNWISQDTIRIAEYYEVTSDHRDLVELDNGHVGWEDELDKDVKDKIDDGSIKVLDRRESDDRKIMWYKVTAVEVLEEREWLGEWIPIVKVIGDEIDVQGKVKYSGVIRNAKDPQRMVNYWETAYTELVALAPKAPYIGAEGQFEGYETEWKQANVKSLPYLQYKPHTIAGQPLPAPQRQQPVQVPQGIQQAMQNAAQNMMATTGIRFDATLQERMVDESGKAVRELRRSGDIGAFHYVDNVQRSLRHTGRILIDLIPKIYDRKRMVTILREDDGEEQVQLDPSAPKPFQEHNPQPTPQDQNPRTLKIFNPTYGHYGVTVDIGPSYATKRIEASENLLNFAKVMPNVAPMIADLIAKYLDFEGSDEMARRLAKAVPAQLMTPDRHDITPQVQAMLQSMQMQIQQLTMQSQQLHQALTERQTDRAQHQDEINKAFQAKVLALKEKFAETLIKAGMDAQKAQQEAALMIREQDHDMMTSLLTHVVKPVIMANGKAKESASSDAPTA